MDDEVSYFINNSSINDESMIGSVYNYDLPNITRKYDDAIKDSLDKAENSDGENFNYVFDPDYELDESNEIIDDHLKTKKRIEIFKKTLHIPQGLDSKDFLKATKKRRKRSTNFRS